MTDGLSELFQGKEAMKDHSSPDTAQHRSIERRDFLTGIGVAALVAGSAGPAAAQDAPAPAVPAEEAAPTPFRALNGSEAEFLTAAVDMLIPADDLSPAASDVGVVTYIDGQLASAWGAGAGMYRSGPFQAGTPEQGPQLPLTPREMLTMGIAAVDEWTLKAKGQPFARLEPTDRLAALKQLEAGQAALAFVDGKAFFELLLQVTMEGFFADPLYGGNRGMAGWRLLGFPGLPAFYAAEMATHHGKRFVAPAKSIGDFL